MAGAAPNLRSNLTFIKSDVAVVDYLTVTYMYGCSGMTIGPIVVWPAIWLPGISKDCAQQ